MNYQITTIESVLEELAQLPKGTVVLKDIGGTKRPYLQWKENGKTRNKYLRQEEVELVKKQVERRKELSALLKTMQTEVQTEVHEEEKISYVPIGPIGAINGAINRRSYSTNVISGKALDALVADALGFQKRDCFDRLDSFLSNQSDKKVCAIYGLRRSGKTVMIKQAIAGIEAYQNCCAYIKLKQADDLGSLAKDIDRLIEGGIKYIFLDEITLLPDFINGAALLSDVYAEMGIKIVLSGTDSLGFLLASGNELYDRCHLIRTTFISYKEHSRLLGINDIDEYLRYGGTLKAGVLNFDKTVDISQASFRDDESTRQYIDTAICYNIQNSLKYFMGGHFRGLEELYQAGVLTNVINKIIENENHKFTVGVITKAFSSGDYGSAAQIARKNIDSRYRILDSIDKEKVVKDLMKILDISNDVNVSQRQIDQVKEYLGALDLIDEVRVESLPPDVVRVQTVVAQPGLRFCQAEALVFSLEHNAEFLKASKQVQGKINNIILSDVAGELLEEIVLMSVTKKCRTDLKKKFEVCKLQLFDGDIDMLIYNKESNTCQLYEIKHSKERDKNQYKRLIDSKTISDIEGYYGRVTGKYVLYRGEDFVLKNGIQYLNVEGYLKNL